MTTFILYVIIIIMPQGLAAHSAIVIVIFLPWPAASVHDDGVMDDQSAESTLEEKLSLSRQVSDIVTGSNRVSGGQMKRSGELHSSELWLEYLMKHT